MATLSRSERILNSIIKSEEYNESPQSRVESQLLELKEVIEKGGGGGGGVPTGEDDFEPTDVEDIMSVISTDNEE